MEMRVNVVVQLLVIPLFLLCAQSAASQTCESNRLETLRLRFEKQARSAKCVGTAPALSVLSVRASCLRNNPIPEKLQSALSSTEEEYSAEAASCDDRFKRTWIGMLERLGRSCDVFLAKSSFAAPIELDQVPQRLTRAAIQCLSDSPDARESIRSDLASFIGATFSQTTPQSWPKLRRDLLTSELDSFAFAGVGQGAPHATDAATAAAVLATANGTVDQWRSFIARVADQFDSERPNFAPQLQSVDSTASQLRLASRLLRGP